jgi:dTDP-4-dehydrorhamnose 3,5-epimerase
VVSVNFTQVPVEGAWFIEPHLHYEFRGSFMRAWCANEFAQNGVKFTLPGEYGIQSLAMIG